MAVVIVMNKYSKERQKHYCEQYMKEHQESGKSVIDFCKANVVSDFSIRRWMEKYFPDYFYEHMTKKKRGDNFSYTNKKSNKSAKKQEAKPVQVLTEHYTHDGEPMQQNMLTDSTPKESSYETKQEAIIIDQLKERVRKLEKENEFLKKQVAYWTRQPILSEDF